MSNPNSETQDEALLKQILEDMLQRNENITARAVARLHPHISHASTITRSESRSNLLKQYQTKQQEIRKHVGQLTKRSKESTAILLANKDQRIAELERQLDLLRSSHLAMIRAVGELGGISKWARFYEGYQDARDQLYRLNAIPVPSTDLKDESKLGVTASRDLTQNPGITPTGQ